MFSLVSSLGHPRDFKPTTTPKGDLVLYIDISRAPRPAWLVPSATYCITTQHPPITPPYYRTHPTAQHGDNLPVKHRAPHDRASIPPLRNVCPLKHHTTRTGIPPLTTPHGSSRIQQRVTRSCSEVTRHLLQSTASLKSPACWNHKC